MAASIAPASGTSSVDVALLTARAAGLVRQDEVEPADPGGVQLAGELRQAGQRRPHQHRVRDRVQADRLQVGDGRHHVVVAAGAAQRVVDVARPVDAHQRPHPAACRSGELPGHLLVDEAVEEEPCLGTVPAREVVHQLHEVPAEQRVAADEHEARGAERHGLVDGILPLGGRELMLVADGIPVVAVPACATTGVGEMQVDLAQAGQGLAAQRRVPGEARENGQIGRLVDVHPQGQLEDLHAGGPGPAQGLGQQRRLAHRGAQQQTGEDVAPLPPQRPAAADEVVAAVRGGSQHEPAAGGGRESPLEVLDRDGRAVAVDDDHGGGAGCEQIGHDVCEPLAESGPALLETSPAPGPAGQRVRCVDAGRRARCRQDEVHAVQQAGLVQCPEQEVRVGGESGVVAELRGEARLHGAAHGRSGHHRQGRGPRPAGGQRGRRLPSLVRHVGDYSSPRLPRVW